MASHRTQPVTRVALVLALATAAVAVSACSGPPMLAKADLDSGKLPKKHPKLTEQQIQAGCRSCHRERPDAPQPK